VGSQTNSLAAFFVPGGWCRHDRNELAITEAGMGGEDDEMSTEEVAAEVLSWLVKLEERTALSGWDQEPSLWVCSLLHAAEADDVGMMTMRNFPMPPEAASMGPGLFMDTMSMVLHLDEARRNEILRLMTGRPDGRRAELYAVVLVNEGVAFPIGTSDEEVSRMMSDDHYVDQELRRVVYGADCAGVMYSVVREKTTGVVTTDHSLMPGGGGVTGGMIDALGRFLWALNGTGMTAS
jgi:hypothetical protein